MFEPKPEGMTTQNKVGVTTLLSGLVVFLYDLGHILSNHSSWVELRTPPAVGEFMIALAAAIAVVIGAGITDFSKLLRQGK
jgi:hypothetical protein